MLKKTRYFYATILIILLFALILDIVTEDDLSYLGIAYFCTFIILSIFLISRGFIYKIDTNIYFGILILASPLIQLLISLGIKNYLYYCGGIFLILALASLVIWLYFKNNFHKMLNFIFLGEFIIFFISIYLTNLKFWYLIIMASLWIFLVSTTFIIKKQSHKKFVKK